MYLFIIELLERLMLGKHLMFLSEWRNENFVIVGLVGFAYGLVLLYGSTCVRKKLPQEFNRFVFDSSSKILRENENISVDKLADKVYKEWVNYIPSLPGNIRIPTEKGFWIEKPTKEALEERLFFNKDKIISMFSKSKEEA